MCAVCETNSLDNLYHAVSLFQSATKLNMTKTLYFSSCTDTQGCEWVACAIQNNMFRQQLNEVSENGDNNMGPTPPTDMASGKNIIVNYTSLLDP